MPAVTTERNGPISIIRIARPERLNAINQAVAVEMQQAFQAFDADPEQRVAILSSEGTRAFSSGADVNDLPELWRAIPGVGFHTDKPIIGATTGWVVGGGIVMVMLCDLLVSTEDTTFYYPEAKLGTTAGGISSLAGRMPHHLAMEIMLLGAKVPAKRAYDVGFVNRVVPRERLMDEDCHLRRKGVSMFGPGLTVVKGLPYEETDDLRRMSAPYNERRRLTFAYRDRARPGVGCYGHAWRWSHLGTRRGLAAHSRRLRDRPGVWNHNGNPDQASRQVRVPQQACA